MCRLFALTSRQPVSPMRAIEALNVMKEGHDGSGVGLFLNGLGGPFEALPDCPILSGIFSDEGLRRLEQYAARQGFIPRHSVILSPKTKPPFGTPQRGTYLATAYDTPAAWKDMTREERELRLLHMRLELRRMGEKEGGIRVFSFWPDTVMIKEVGDPVAIAEYLKLDRP